MAEAALSLSPHLDLEYALRIADVFAADNGMFKRERFERKARAIRASLKSWPSF